MQISRFYHTIRHLRLGQIMGQVRHRLLTRLENPGAFAEAPIPQWPGCRWNPIRPFLPPGEQRNRAEGILSGNMTFLNDPREIGWMPDWNRADLPKLWQYNLHYFEWLWALDYANARAVTMSWMEKHPLKRRQVGWESYPISLRLTNWCSFFFGVHRQQTESDIAFCGQLWESIYRQAQWLSRHLEYHLAGNHLFENAAALAFAGCCCRGKLPEYWRRKGYALLQKEIHEQILPDGLHFERSPMYHLRLIYLLNLLASSGDRQLQAIVEEPLARMQEALTKTCHPDGQVALLNDSAFGIYNPPRSLVPLCDQTKQTSLKVSGRTGEETGAWSLPDAGYYGWRDADGNYVICDAGAIGPDYIPGHAHADIFSFELSLRGHRVIVDSGVCDYERSDMRKYCRSTQAHNTVQIEGEDQSEMWASFRVARRGSPRDVKWTPCPDGFRLEGWHDGYSRLDGSPIHSRRFEWLRDGCLLVRDLISAKRSVNAVSRIHLHPDCRIGDVSEHKVKVRFPAGEFTISYETHGTLSLEESRYCPEFGISIPNKTLAFSSHGQKMENTARIEVQSVTK